jgi:hypothetical protein
MDMVEGATEEGRGIGSVELLMDLEEDPVTRTTVIGMLRVMGSPED